VQDEREPWPEKDRKSLWVARACQAGIAQTIEILRVSWRSVSLICSVSTRTGSPRWAGPGLCAGGFTLEQRWLGACHVWSTLDGALAEAAGDTAGGFVVRLWAEQVQHVVSESSDALRVYPFAEVATGDFDGGEGTRERYQVGASARVEWSFS
jgi:hypothetical protein